MCFLRSSAVLLVVAAFAAARPAFSGNYGDDNDFGGYSASSRLGGLTGGYISGSNGYGSNSYNSQRTRSVAGGYGSGFGNNENDFSGSNYASMRRYGSGFGNNENDFSGSNYASMRRYGSGFGNNENDFSGSNYASSRGDGFSGNGMSDNGMSGFSAASGNGFNGISGSGFSGVGSFSSVPGVLFAFPSLTSVSYSRVPQQNDDLVTLAVLSALLADSENNNDNNDADAVQTVSRQTYTDTTARDSNNQGSKVAFVPVVTVPAAAEQQKTTKIVKTTIETDGSVSNIPGLNGDFADIAAGSSSDSFGANADSSASSRRSYSPAATSSSSSSATAGASSRLY